MKCVFLFFAVFAFLFQVHSQNVGIGTAAPKSKLDVNGNMAVGSSYAGTTAAPASGAIIQGPVGIGNNNPNASAILDLTNSGNIGFLPPSMTLAQRNAISTPALGLMIFNTDNHCLETNLSAGVANWKSVCPCTTAPATPGTITGTSSGMCTGTSYTYSISPVVSANSYVWAVTGGSFATITGQGTTSVTVTFASNATTAVTVQASNSCGVSSAGSLSVSFASVNSSLTISGCTTVGATQAVAYSVSPTTNATSYSWSVTGGGSVTSGAGTSSVTVTYTGTVGTQAAKTVSVTETGCANSSSASQPVTSGGKSAYFYKGTAQTFTSNCATQYYVELWGAAGGCGGDGTQDGTGGAGGYVAGTLTLATSTAYTVIVGQGGYRYSNTAMYGGGAGGASGSGGCGGGRSAIRNTGNTADLVTAGGGGGAGYMNTIYCSPSGGNYGGGGGGLTGASGGDVCNSGGAATGGTQTGGGNAGTGYGYNGSAGSAYTGGTGSSTNYGGGGGGGGYFGGGGGAGDYGGGGGGGSSYIANLTSALGTVYNQQGGTNTAGNNTAQSPYVPSGDVNYDLSGYYNNSTYSSANVYTVGYAPAPGSGDGGQGEVVIEW